MERKADLIFKGQVISTRAVSNSFFPYWAKTHAAQFKLISLLKGHVGTNAPVFWYMTHGPDAWGGGSEPSWHQIELGQTYLVYAASHAKPEYLFSVPLDGLLRSEQILTASMDHVSSAYLCFGVRGHFTTR